MSNEEIARRLGVSLDVSQGFSGFYLGHLWIGGKTNDREFTITLRDCAAPFRQKAASFATCYGES